MSGLGLSLMLAPHHPLYGLLAMGWDSSPPILLQGCFPQQPKEGNVHGEEGWGVVICTKTCL